MRRIVKLSAPVVTAPASVEAARWHREIEAVLAASGLEHASLRPHAFMQNWLRQADVIQHTNTILGSAGTAPRNYVDARDVAAIAARLLSSEVPLSGATFAVSGPEAISNADMAVRLSYVTGTEVRYENLTRAGHERALVEQARLPAWLARHLVELEELAVLMPEPFTSTVPELLGTTPRTMDEFIHEHRLAFVSQAQPQQAQPQRARL